MALPEEVHLFDDGDVKGADDAEADPLGVGVEPDGFGLLWVFVFPPLFGEFTSRRAEVFRGDFEAAAAGHAGIAFFREHERRVLGVCFVVREVKRYSSA